MLSSLARLQDDLKLGLSCVKILWRYKTKSWATSVYAADIDQDGDMEVLASSRDGRAYALTREGHLLWSREVGTKAWVSSIVGLSLPLDQYLARVITSTRDGKVYVLDKNGEMLRKNVLLPPAQKISSSLLPTESYWYDAHQAITQLHTNPSSPFEVVFASEDRCVYGFDLAHGEIRWRFVSGGHIKAIFMYDVDGDGRLETLVGADDHTLSLLSSSGQLLAQHQMDQSVYALCAADLDRDGVVEILVGTRSKKLSALTPDLREKWSQALSSRPLALSVADVNNDQRLEILAACDDRSLAILDNAGKSIWRQNVGTRFYSLSTLDLDRDGHVEVLAGADDHYIYTLRIQLSKELDKKIRRAYLALGKPEPETLLDLTGEQRDLLLDVLGTNYRSLDKTLNLEAAEMALAEGDANGALLALLKLAQQKFQFLWEKESIGYLNTLCFGNFAGDSRRVTVVGTPDGGLAAFNPAGRLLWSKTSTEEYISDAQAGYLSRGRGEDLAFLASSGRLFLMSAESKRESSVFPFPEPVSCFSNLAFSRQGPSELLLGTESGKVYLYTNDFQHPAQVLSLPDNVQAVYASAPHEGVYRTPEILISTASNQLLAYTRGGNCLWRFEAHDRVLAFCAKDLDGDGRLEVLVGSEDCNVSVLDHQGNRRWRYVLPDSVQAIEAVDLDGDGNLELLAGCADGILYVFTSTGDLIWRYQARDRIQALRVDDIDQDGNQEVAIVAEGSLEVLQVVNQAKLALLISACWSSLLNDRTPLTALLAFIKGLDPYLRGAALHKLVALHALSSDIFDLLEEATRDTFIAVRKVLPEAVMLAYPADPARARSLLNVLFTDKIREVRIEVIEHLELLARYDWSAALSYLSRACESSNRQTRRAAIRKVSHLIGFLSHLTDASAQIQAEALFKLLLNAAQDAESEWIRQEAGRVLADLLNLYSEDFLVYFYRLLASQLQPATLRYTAYNLAPPEVQQAFTRLLDLCFELPPTNALASLTSATHALEPVRHMRRGTDIWLICRELQDLFALDTLEDLASYEFHLKPEQVQEDNLPAQSFVRIGGRFNTITRSLKTYLRRNDPNDRLNSLLDGLNALDDLQRQVEREYGASPVPGAPQPRVPEFVVLIALLARWKGMLHAQRNELRGHAELVCELQSHEAHFEDVVGIWLLIANHGRGSATNVKVTLLSNESFELLRPSFETDAIFARQEIVAEFFIKPLAASASVTLTFEVFYDDSERDSLSFTAQDYLDFIEWQRAFTPINNPYTTGTPIQDSRMCYGREVDLAYLQDNLTRTTAQTVLVLYGQRRSGKTTLLYQLAHTPLLAQHVPILIDMQRLAYNLDLNNFLFKVAYTIYQALQKKGLLLSPPARMDYIDQKDFKPDPMFSFDCFLDEVEILLEERKLILLLDEFEVLETQVNHGKLKPEIFQYLRSLMQQRQYMHFLLSGTHHIEGLTRDYWSVFFNIALHYRLPGKITHSGSEDLITRPVAGSLEYEPLAVAKIRQLTADQPYLIHLVCRALIDHCNQQRKNYATINDVNLVLRDVMATGAVHFDWLWNQIEPARQILLRVIAEGAGDEGRQLSLDDISNIYRQHHLPYHRDEVVASLKTLWAEDVVETNDGVHLESLFDGAHYHVSIGLLRQWLRREKPLTAVQTEPEWSLYWGNAASTPRQTG